MSVPAEHPRLENLIEDNLVHSQNCLLDNLNTQRSEIGNHTLSSTLSDLVTSPHNVEIYFSDLITLNIQPPLQHRSTSNMCRIVKTVHYGCEEIHSEEVLIRCKPAMEYQLDMPINKDVCRGMVEIECWVMSSCRFCEEYLTSRKHSQRRKRAASLDLKEAPDTKRDMSIRSIRPYT